jgi:hypothetical protein
MPGFFAKSAKSLKKQPFDKGKNLLNSRQNYAFIAGCRSRTEVTVWSSGHFG